MIRHFVGKKITPQPGWLPIRGKNRNLFLIITLEAISKMQITFKDKARADEKAEHTREYVSTLRRSATP
jgi:hypothetical protein